MSNTNKTKIKRQYTYRQIYIKYHGPIPKDSEGRNYDIHHIDGNPNNNDPNNLKAVSILEHYNIHYSQGDYSACILLANRLKKSQKEISELAKKANKQRVDNGTHPWLGLSNPVYNRIENGLQSQISRNAQISRILDGTHNFITNNPSPQKVLDGTHNLLGGAIQSKTQQRRLAEGTHNLVGDKNPVHKLVESGEHPWLGPDWNNKLLSEGKHPSQIKLTCPHCGKTCSKGNAIRHHFDNCKSLR